MIRCLAIDDEPLALKQLENYISKVYFLQLVSACQSAMDAIDILGKEKVDVLFCDINMPDLDGMSFIKSLTNPPLVVFTTAYSEYAVEGFKVNALDYLLKPFSFSDFLRAAMKVRNQFELENKPDSPESCQDDSIYFKTDYKIVRVEIDRILYIEGMSEYLKIHLDNVREPVIVLLSMKKIEDRLPSGKFMRIHKSFIINLHKISQLTKGQVIMEGGATIPTGELYRNRLMEHVNARFLTR